MLQSKKIYLLLAFVLYAVTYSQTNNDTLFIKKDNHQKIYIEKNKNSNYYKDLNNFKDFAAINTKEKINQVGLSTKWIRIYKYKGKYILYAPCDWMNDTKIMIDDNKIQFKNAETVDHKIKCIKKRDENVIIKYKDRFLKKNVLLRIIPVDKEKGIYQFDTKRFQYIMVEADKYQNFDILVNECIDSKLKEFKFDK